MRKRSQNFVREKILTQGFWSKRIDFPYLSLVARELHNTVAQAIGEIHSPQVAQLTVSSILTSPMVDIIVGQGENKTTLKAHQTLLLESPFMNEFISKFETAGPVRRDRRIRSHLPCR
jgi:hypothetical protein